VNYAERLRKIRLAMEQRGIDLVFLTPSANMQYVTGIPRDRPHFGNLIYPGGWVLGTLIGREKGPILLAPRMVAEFDLPETAFSDVRALPDRGDPLAFMATALAEFGPVRRVAIEDRAWAETVLNLHRLLPEAGWTVASELLAPLRAIKDEEEIAVMRKAAHLADAVFAAVLPRLQAGMSELEVALEVDTQMAQLGAEGPSFTTNVFLFGASEARDIREKASSRLLAEGLSLSFDFGCVYEGYCSDFGRTVFIGEPPSEFRRAYETVIAAHDVAMRAMKGSATQGAITAGEADRIARAVVEEAGFGPHFRHRLGHGIGLDVHEGPFLTAGDDTVLQPGMAFTVEPSIFWPGHIGTRVEDVVIVRPDGGESLNESSTALALC
jgi:Xaa-Pro aminopeptidase